MKVAFVTSELAPFAKTGGLADVSGSLPREIARLKHEICVIAPLYREVRETHLDLIDEKVSIDVPLGSEVRTGRVFQRLLPDSEVPVFFVDYPPFFDRDGLYGSGDTEYSDNASRFIFFCRAALECLARLKIHPDVIHVNDWQTGLIPVYLKTLYRERLPKSTTLFTIHNIAYQGLFWHWDMALTGLPWDLFNYRQLEFYGKINFLKGGLAFADVLSTVSPHHALEMQTDEFGCGLEGVLRERAEDLYGVVNGVDYNVWNPETDAFLAKPYSADHLEGKAACKAALQKELGLPVKKVPLIGMVARLADQKGLDLVADSLRQILALDVQFALLGLGRARYQDLFGAAARAHPDRIAAVFRMDDGLAHRIEAGSDLFLMPSRYEPCGLNQLYSLKYGAVPVARRTGGLADTITDATPALLAKGKASGFLFDEYTADAMMGALRRALAAFGSRPTWESLVACGMRQDWSWARSAREYVKLYKKAKARLP